jgi:hypothetical protein
METKAEKKAEVLKPRIVAFLHVTKDVKVVEQVELERAPKITKKFLSDSVKLIELVSRIGSDLNLDGLQTISMTGRKGRFDLRLLLHLSSPNLYGITFVEKPSLEERFERALRFKGL